MRRIALVLVLVLAAYAAGRSGAFTKLPGLGDGGGTARGGRHADRGARVADGGARRRARPRARRPPRRGCRGSGSGPVPPPPAPRGPASSGSTRRRSTAA